jgi:hypothetical protein
VLPEVTLPLVHIDFLMNLAPDVVNKMQSSIEHLSIHFGLTVDQNCFNTTVEGCITKSLGLLKNVFFKGSSLVLVFGTLFVRYFLMLLTSFCPTQC